MGRMLASRHLFAAVARTGFAVTIGAAVLAGCTADDGTSGPIRFPGEGGGVTRLKPGEPFAVDITESALARLRPERIRVHPLSTISLGADGTPQLVCHVELRDHFGHAVKGLGVLVVEAFRTGPGGQRSTAGSGVVAAAWGVDLTSPDENAAFYDDLVLHTYTVTLTDIPDWVADFARGESREPFVRIRVTFHTLDVNGKRVELRDSYRIEGG